MKKVYIQRYHRPDKKGIRISYPLIISKRFLRMQMCGLHISLRCHWEEHVSSTNNKRSILINAFFHWILQNIVKFVFSSDKINQ
jgi:hypothetical protein